VNLAQVVHWLNKLDAGVAEKMVLSSRDLSSLVVLGYDDLKRFVDTSFTELLSRKKLQTAPARTAPPIDQPSTPPIADSRPTLNVDAPDFILN
jgi:hypothetical protein